MGFGDVDVFLGVDVGKSEHWVQAIGAEGVELFGRVLDNDEADIEAMLAEAAGCGRVAVVVDMTSANARLLLGAAADRGVLVAYVTGLQMRRAAQLYAGVAKTDPRDAWVLADFARRNAGPAPWGGGQRRTVGFAGSSQRSGRRPGSRR